MKKTYTAVVTLCVSGIVLLEGCSKEAELPAPSTPADHAQMVNSTTDPAGPVTDDGGLLVLVQMGQGSYKLKDRYDWPIGNNLTGLDAPEFGGRFGTTTTVTLKKIRSDAIW